MTSFNDIQCLSLDSVIANMQIVSRASGIGEPEPDWTRVATKLKSLNDLVNNQNNLESRFLLLVVGMHASNLLYASCCLFALYRMARDWSLRPGICETRLLLSQFTMIDGVVDVWKRFDLHGPLRWSRQIRSLIAAPGIECELELLLAQTDAGLHLTRCLGLLGTPFAVNLLEKMSFDQCSVDVRCAAECELAFLGHRFVPIALLSRLRTHPTDYTAMFAIAVLGLDDGIKLILKALETVSGTRCLQLLYSSHPLVFQQLGEVSDIKQAIRNKLLHLDS